jgi:hypothetical protein
VNWYTIQLIVLHESGHVSGASPNALKPPVRNSEIDILIASDSRLNIEQLVSSSICSQ